MFFVLFFACSNTTVDTDTIYSDLHIFKTTLGAPEALLLQEGWRPAEGGPGAGCSGTSLGRSGAGRSLLAACGGSLPLSDMGGWEKMCFLGGSMFDALGEGWTACQRGQKHAC